MATIYKSDGSTEMLELRNLGDGDQLRALQNAVGGYIELIQLRDGCYLFVNEDGTRDDLPPNVAATRIVADRASIRLPPGGLLLGNAVLCEPDEVG